MYSEIHQLKNVGLKKSQVARKLNINVKTVGKYWLMDTDEFARLRHDSFCNSRKLNQYKEVILMWLRQFPDLDSAQALDWIKEHYSDYSVKERTLRKFVSCLRVEHNIPKTVNQRQYQAVPDPPMGMQMQLDFGEKVVRNSENKNIKIYGMGVVLSHSRYKYAEWSDGPLTTITLVNMMIRCFEYISGMPKELVFDQDKLVAVSENYGDVIYTHEFEKFKQNMNFKVRLCRKADPESKGKVEAVIKYVKNNFAAHRLFTSINTFNQECLDWLDRTANNKVHGTTKKVPAEVFLLEQQHLQPIPPLFKMPVDIVTRAVRKDNTILYKSNRYSVPVGTYKPGLELETQENNTLPLTGGYPKLVIIEPDSGKTIAEHTISKQKGALIQNNNHLRQYEHKIEELYQKTLMLLGSTSKTVTLLQVIRKEKSRYVRDQYQLIQDLVKTHPMPVLNQAVEYCCQHKLYSAVELRDAAVHFSKLKVAGEQVINQNNKLPDHLKIKADVRDISA